MKTPQLMLIAALGALSILALLGAGSAKHRSNSTTPVQRGKFLVNLGGCNDCHTPLKMGARGPEPDFSRYLSGHPQDAQLPPPPALTNTPWNAVTAGFTAWSGPWGVSYAANLTPDETTGLGIWTEEMFLKAMRTGQHMGGGRPIFPPMPWQALAQLPDEDLKAILACLRTIPPLKNRVLESVPPGGGWE